MMPLLRIIVTGAASGIGAAICRRMAGPGTAFLVHTRRNRACAEATADHIRRAGGTASIAMADLAMAGSGRRLVAQAGERLGGLDIMIANAGYALRTALSEVSDGEFSRAHDAITRSFFEMATAAIPDLRNSSQGRIIAISSFGQHVWRPGVPSFPATSAAKSAVETLARALALELAPDGITVNAVAPGFVEKDAGAHKAMPPAALAATLAHIPMRRAGRQDEIAAAVEFLASTDASYITGQIIHVNGGLA